MKLSSMKSTIILLLMFCSVLVAGGLLVGCGQDGATGQAGPAGAPGTVTPTAKAETCLLCHAGDAIEPPSDIHPNVAANVTPNIVATIDSVVVTAPTPTSQVFTINFTVRDSGGAFITNLGDRAAPDATGKASANLAYLRFAYAKLVTDFAGETRWVSYDQGQRAFANLTDFGTGTYTYVCSALTTTTGITNYDPTATTRIGLQISTAAGATWRPLQITYTFVPDGVTPLQSRAIVSTVACAECHGTQNGIVHGTRYNADYCVVCHTRETLRNGETVEFKSMVHQIHTSQTRSFLDSAEVTYPQDILDCAKCHHGAVDVDNWKNVPSIEACNSCHYVYFGDPLNPLPAGLNAKHSGGGPFTNTNCTTCHFAGASTKKDPAVAHLTINATPNNPNVPAGDVNFKYEIKSVALNSTSSTAATFATITFRILANENATPATPVTFATYTTGATMLTVGTRTFSGSPSFLLAYALPQEGLTNNAATMNDFNNLGKTAAQPTSVSITNIWDGSKGTLTGPDGSGYYTATLKGTSQSFPAGAKMRTVALQGYFTQSDTGDGRHTLSVTGTVSGDVVRRSVVDPVKCGACHEWFEGHGGNRNIGLGSASAPVAGKDNGIVVCVLCHVPNLSSSGRGADPATVLSRMSISDQQKMTAAGYNPADPSTYPEESMNLKDLIHATHASGMRTEPFRFVRDRGTSGVFYYDMSEVTFPGRIGDCEICHYSGTVKPYNMPDTAGLLSSTNETTDGNAATSVTTDRSAVPNASDIVTPPLTAACITCHDQSLPVTHIEAQGGSSKVKRSDAVR